MGFVVGMTIQDFFGEFVKGKKLDDYEVLIISKDITASITRRVQNSDTYESKYSNVDLIPSLYPNPSVIQYSYNTTTDAFFEAYTTQLDDKDNFSDLCCIVDMAVNDNRKIIILYSFVEEKSRFFDCFREFMNRQFDLTVHCYRDIKEGEDELVEIENPEEVKARLEYHKDILIKDADLDFFFNRFTEDLAEKYKELLLEKSEDSLRKIAKHKGIFIPVHKDKEQIVKIILDTMLGNEA